MANQATGIRKVLVSGGIVAVAAVVGMVVFDYPPATEDAAGTIVPAKRFRADGAGTSIVGDSTATQSGIATDRASTDAANAVMADGLARSQTADAAIRNQAVAADAVARNQAMAADAVTRSQAVAADASIRNQALAADAVTRSQAVAADASIRSQAATADAVTRSQAVAADASIRNQAAAADAVARSQAADAAIRAQ